jgi:hypothetical protein
MIFVPKRVEQRKNQVNFDISFTAKAINCGYGVPEITHILIEGLALRLSFKEYSSHFFPFWSDSRGNYMTDREFSGVWVSDRPLDCNDGAWGDALLRIEMPFTDADFADLEWIEENKNYREWLLPASYLNANALLTLEQN